MKLLVFGATGGTGHVVLDLIGIIGKNGFSDLTLARLTVILKQHSQVDRLVDVGGKRKDFSDSAVTECSKQTLTEKRSVNSNSFDFLVYNNLTC